MSLYDLQQETAKIAKQIEDRIHATELEKAQFAMEAKNAKDRAALLESLNKSLEDKNAALEEKQAALEKRIKVQDEGRELMKGRIGALEQKYQNACAVGDNLKEQILKMARQQENAELAAEALKAKLKRKNERIQRLEEANQGYRKGIQHLKKRIADMERIMKIKDDGRKSMRQQIADLIDDNQALRRTYAKKAKELSAQNEQLRKNCDQQVQEIWQLLRMLNAYRYRLGHKKEH